MCRVETVGQHGLRVGEVLRVPEVDGVEGHGYAFLSVVLKAGVGRDARPVIAVLLFFKKLPALGEAFFRAAHPGFVVLQAVFDDGGKVEADLAV